MGADLTEHATGKFSRDVYIKGDSSWNKIAYNGTVTTYTDTTHFASTDLTGFGNDYFNNWYVYVVRDAAGAAPQGEMKAVSDYVSSTGTFTHTAFSAILAVGDEVMLIHETVAKTWLDVVAIDTLTEAGGTGDLTSVKTEVDAILDLTRDGGTATVTNVETVIKEDATPGKVKEGVLVRIDRTAMQAGDTFVFKEYYKFKSGGNYILEDSKQYTGVQTVPSIPITLLSYRWAMKVTATRTAGANRDMDWESYIGE